MPGEYEPNDSRNVTGQSRQGMGTPGGADQQIGAPRWGGDSQQDQQQASPEERQQQAGQDFAGRDYQQQQSQGANERHAEGASGQQSQFESGSAGQMGGGAGSMQTGEAASPWAQQIREHMQVIGADDVPVGKVDALEGHRIKLTRSDSMGSHAGHHHYLSCGLVAGVEGDCVRLSATAANAQQMLQEE